MQSRAPVFESSSRCLNKQDLSANSHVLQLCYRYVVASSTSSFRISDQLKARLDEAALRLKKGKNWIINQALDEYLSRNSLEALRVEARRQSLLASKKRWKDEKFWEKAAAEVWND